MTELASDPSDVMKLVREFWRESVGLAGSNDMGPEAPVVVAFRAAWAKIQDGRSISDSIADSVRATSEWKNAHRSVVSDIYESIMGRLPGSEEIESLEMSHDADEIARRVVALQDADNENHASPEGHGPLVSAGEPEIEEDWMHAFADAFGRDPFVHEYVLVRPMAGDLKARAKTHALAFQQMRDIHIQYLDERISEQTFVKLYVPRIYKEEGVPESVRKIALRRPEYREAMRSRLSSLHMVASGRDLSQHEADYLFDTTVLQKELPLDTGELNDVVSEFVRRGEEIRARIAHLIDVYLRREPDCDEVDDWVFAFRTSSDADHRLRQELIAGREFHAVLASTILYHLPDMRPRELYRRVDAALSKTDLSTVETRHDFDKALEAAGILEESCNAAI